VHWWVTEVGLYRPTGWCSGLKLTKQESKDSSKEPKNSLEPPKYSSKELKDSSKEANHSSKHPDPKHTNSHRSTPQDQTDQSKEQAHSKAQAEYLSHPDPKRQ